MARVTNIIRVLFEYHIINIIDESSHDFIVNFERPPRGEAGFSEVTEASEPASRISLAEKLNSDLV
jgi:hypothetical protein